MIYKHGFNNGYNYIGITDKNRLNFLKTHSDNIGQFINFWTPGRKSFKAIKQGELFLFKLHSKAVNGEYGEIVGGAYFPYLRE